MSRYTVRGFLDESEVGEHTADATLLIVTELMSNGVLHAGGRDIDLWVNNDFGKVTVQVITADRPPGDVPVDRQLADHDATGHGLLIVDTLSDEVATHSETGVARRDAS